MGAAAKMSTGSHTFKQRAAFQRFISNPKTLKEETPKRQATCGTKFSL
jgi:hypothetical protein